MLHRDRPACQAGRKIAELCSTSYSFYYNARKSCPLIVYLFKNNVPRLLRFRPCSVCVYICVLLQGFFCLTKRAKSSTLGVYAHFKTITPPCEWLANQFGVHFEAVYVGFVGCLVRWYV